MKSKFKHHSFFAKERLWWLYLWPYACFQCRLAFKRPYGEGARPCPTCGGSAVILGRNFRPPKKSAKDDWEVIRFLHSHGFVFQHVKDENGRYVAYPTSMKEAREFVVKFAEQKIPE